MNLLKFCLLSLMINSFHPCFSQSDSISCKRESSRIKVALNSSLVYPGARFGIESPFKTTHIARTLPSGEIKSVFRSQFITSNISWYHHPDFHDNLYLTFGWTLRRTGPKGWYWDFSPEAGVSRTFLGGTTYKVSENGTVSIQKLAGYYYALISLGGGVGYDFSVVKFKPFQIFYKFNLLNMFPYNSTIYVRPAMELGVSYKISAFRPLRIKVREITK